MRITNVTLRLFSWNGIPPTSYGVHTGAPVQESKLGLLAIETSEGLTGHAFLGSVSFPADIDGPSLIRFLKPLLIGQDPLNRERIYRSLWARARNTSVRAIGAVDIALWDLAGKIAGLPIHQLIGTSRERIPAYASSQVLEGPEAYAEEALRFKELGWHAYKIHPRQKWKEDIQACEAVRKAVGDDFTLMLDSTWAYQYGDALRVGLALQDMNYYWYEDPLAEQDLYNYTKLREKLHIPIMATEYPAASLESYAPWITGRATDFLRGDVAVKGGITNLLKIAHLAEAFHMNLEVHHGGNSLNNLANLHVIMAIRNTEFFEILLPDAAQKYGMVNDIVVDQEGYVNTPNGPGLGGEIDFKLINDCSVGILS
ncbi:MAG: enolase C-terminal domain-like protein [Pigmentiphaga sp.]